MAENGSISPQDGVSAQGADEQEKPSLTEEEKPRLTEEEKKQNHIASDMVAHLLTKNKKRREAIRAGFDRLCELVPGLEGQGRSEGLVLGRTVAFIRAQLVLRRELVQAAEARGDTVTEEERAPLAILERLEERDRQYDTSDDALFGFRDEELNEYRSESSETGSLDEDSLRGWVPSLNKGQDEMGNESPINEEQEDKGKGASANGITPMEPLEKHRNTRLAEHLRGESGEYQNRRGLVKYQRVCTFLKELKVIRSQTTHGEPFVPFLEFHDVPSTNEGTNSIAAQQGSE
ncbi:hypothetical protein EKO27_g1977 [Xylaria grammica]|uniref:BHLH domain-containing protein n=1 Tax=Xylaria grammica TaxID=363999 RepID=A0A439DFD2_9PEZI|nr:hypothetical protein EKO27_g1977 [Xylaria grammica]